MKTSRVILLAFIGAALAPATASAATSASVQNGELRVVGDAARNVVSVSARDDEILVRGVGQIGSGCVQGLNDGEASCSRSAINRVTVTLAGGSDDLGQLMPAGVAPVDFSGGDGDDRVRYIGPESQSDPAVTVSLNGLADDGFRGGGDNIRADVERVWTTIGEDRLVGNDAANALNSSFGRDVVQGGGGDDRLVTIDVEQCPDEPAGSGCPGTVDRVECGPGFDIVDGDIADEVAEDCELVARNGGIRGTNADDRITGFRPGLSIGGESGDDRIVGLGSDSLGGGSGNDVIRAGSRWTRRTKGQNSLGGGSGNDLIFGSRRREFVSAGKGNDTVRTYGNKDEIQTLAGNDRVFAGAGNDFVVVKDRGAQRDRVKCGAGRDIVVVDRRDVVSRDCERVTRIDPRFGRTRGR
jgi:Ca2+-binding RTX toxin-like protein